MIMVAITPVPKMTQCVVSYRNKNRTLTATKVGCYGSIVAESMSMIGMSSWMG